MEKLVGEAKNSDKASFINKTILPRLQATKKYLTSERAWFYFEKYTWKFFIPTVLIGSFLGLWYLKYQTDQVVLDLFSITSEIINLQNSALAQALNKTTNIPQLPGTQLNITMPRAL